MQRSKYFSFIIFFSIGMGLLSSIPAMAQDLCAPVSEGTFQQFGLDCGGTDSVHACTISDGVIDPVDLVATDEFEVAVLATDDNLTSADDEDFINILLGETEVQDMVPDELESMEGVTTAEESWISSLTNKTYISLADSENDSTPHPFQMMSINNELECIDEYKSLLLLQAREAREFGDEVSGYASVLEIDGVDVKLVGEMIARLVPGSLQLQFISISGYIYASLDELCPGFDGVLIPKGFSFLFELDEEAHVLADNVCELLSDPQPMSQAQLDLLKYLEEIPANVLNREIHIPDEVCASSVGGAVCTYQ